LKKIRWFSGFCCVAHLVYWLTTTVAVDTSISGGCLPSFLHGKRAFVMHEFMTV